MKSDSIETNHHSSIYTIAMIAMCTAIIAVLSQLSIPLPSGVPVTLQTFGIALTGYLLGWKSGTIATLVYVLLGIVGVPVFANFKGGIAVLFGKTGGFIFGFLLMALFCGLAMEFKKKRFFILLVLFSILGLAFCHLLGILQFMILTKMGFVESALLVSIPYIVKDIVFLVIAYFLSLTIKRALLRG